MQNTEFVPQAGHQLTNFGGIEIAFNASNDGVIYRYNYGIEPPDAPQAAEIEYFESDQDGSPFDHLEAGELRAGFETSDSCRYYLDDFMCY